jgi:DNA-binding NtrC family response regulator
MPDILVVDDDQSVAGAFRRFLEFEGHECRLASSVAEAMRVIAERVPALVFMDIRMPGVDGLNALREIRATYPELYVVMMTGYGTSQTSIDAIRAGAFDYLNKPLDLEELRGVITKALSARKTRHKADLLDSAGGELAPRLVGETHPMREVYKTIGRLAALDVPALIVGEHGTGKRLVAATIHANSSRADRPFVVIDAATTPETAIDTEISAMHGGTVHLRNVDALSPILQAGLVRSLTRPASRGARGSVQPVRVLVSGERDLAAVASSGSVDRELHTALSVVVRLPPLRERREDTPLLVRHFIQLFNAEFDRTIARVDDRVMQMLQAYRWPGNVAELESVIKRGCILARSDVITVDEIGESLRHTSSYPEPKTAESALVSAARTALQERLVDLRPGSPSTVYHDIIDLVESTLVEESLMLTNRNQVKASAILGVNRATLRKKMPSGS